MNHPPLLSTPFEALTTLLGGPGRAAAVTRALRSGHDPFSAEVLGRRPAERLRAVCRPTGTAIEALTAADDGTVKARLGLATGEAVEAVLIPTGRRTTLCLSSQVGCARGCVFCLTATMGLKRHLAADEILAQAAWGVAEVRRRNLPPLRNLVFMGMGEPLDNAAAVAQAVDLLTAPRGWAFSPNHVTVSTVGPSPASILKGGALSAQLAWSVHAARDSVRSRLIPTARYPVLALRDAFATALFQSGRSLFAEVTLVSGVNDAPEDADALVDLLRPLPGETRVNLLPMNPTGTDLRGSSPERVAAFQVRVRAAGLFCAVRKARGERESAACGQLAVGPVRRTRPHPRGAVAT